jgi:hypothetical protein
MSGYAAFYLPIYIVQNGGQPSDMGRMFLVYSLIIVYLGPGMTRFVRRRFPKLLVLHFIYNILFAAVLFLLGILGGFITVAFTMVIIGLADGFGSGAQNDFFMEMPLLRCLSPGRGFALMSLLTKFAAMLGPLVFALALNLPARQGILYIGAVIALLAIAALGGRKLLFTEGNNGNTV